MGALLSLPMLALPGVGTVSLAITQAHLAFFKSNVLPFI